MIFNTCIAGIPCKCRVDKYQPRTQGRRYNDPPEPAEFEYTILDRYGAEAPWLMAKVTDADDARLFEEFEMDKLDEYYNPY